MNNNEIEVIFKDTINLSNKFNEFLINLLIDSIKNRKVYENEKLITSKGDAREDVH